MGGRERGRGGSLFLSGCIPDCAEDPGRLTKPDLAAAPGSSHAARQPTSGTQDSGGEQEHKKSREGGRREGGGGTHPATCWQAGRSSRSGSPRIRTLGKAAAGRSNDLFDPTVSFSHHTHTSRGHRRGQVLVSLRSTQGRPLRMMSSHPVLQRV